MKQSNLNAFFCTVNYRTHGGACSTWAGTIQANDIEQAAQLARERIAKRRTTAKIDGGSTQLIGR